MPRTKRPVRKQEKSAEDNDPLQKLNRSVAEIMKKIDNRADMEVRNVELAFKLLLGSISKTYMQMTVGELKSEMYLREATKATRHSSKSASHDDGSQIPVPPSGRTRRSRSADVSSSWSSRKPAAAAPPTIAKPPSRRRSRSVYRTPAYNKKSAFNYPPITPKVAPNTPMALLRQPRQGEMIVSMSGSPVMVPTCYNMQSDEMANCNILLEDGTMLSLQPKQLRQSQVHIPFSLMNANIFKQLKTLKENIDNIVKVGEKAVK